MFVSFHEFYSSLKLFRTVDNLVLSATLCAVEAGAASLTLSGGIDCLAASRPVSCETLSFPSSSSFSSFGFTVFPTVTVHVPFVCFMPQLLLSSAIGGAFDEVRGATHSSVCVLAHGRCLFLGEMELLEP